MLLLTQRGGRGDGGVGGGGRLGAVGTRRRRDPAGSAAGGVRGDAVGVGAPAVGAVSQAGRDERASVGAGTATGGVQRPVPVAVDAGGGGGVHRSPTLGAKPVRFSTARGYEIALRMFCEYVADPRYGWPAECLHRFGECVTQVFHEGNSLLHLADYEGDPRRRPLTYDEVQALFDAADGQVEQIRQRKRKGAVTAMRDAAMLKTVYAYGLRRRECCCLDLADLRRNPTAAQFGRFGAMFVRFGKSSRGGEPKRRTVLTVPEMDWVVPVLEQWVDEIRPLLVPGQHPALWVTERRGRVSRHGLDRAFETARQAAGLPPELDLHCLRHSYVTHLVEFGYPERFVQEQVGHAYGSTTAIYTGVSDEYRTRLVQKALRQQLGELWETAN